eukprot:CAMPEP_0171582210 /NCGR_PEP_ID=MMETSP0961-20121227/10068_1 /TAXON_ID=87120 /ORGANISM="Aurantiochytrium limacinum, Strain ATCCMYA-1381" /LENGTH=85 /DNA_ID=CAMNT_0012139175 /DNA_START=166 /DNA_END=423 /DNA_ORIENTATION=+
MSTSRADASTKRTTNQPTNQPTNPTTNPTTNETDKQTTITIDPALACNQEAIAKRVSRSPKRPAGRFLARRGDLKSSRTPRVEHE